MFLFAIIHSFYRDFKKDLTMKKCILIMSIVSSFSAFSAELTTEQTYSHPASWSSLGHWNRDVSSSNSYMISNGNTPSDVHLKGQAFSGWTMSGLQDIAEGDKVKKTNAYHFQDTTTQLNTEGSEYSAGYRAVSDGLESGVIRFSINPAEEGDYQARLFTHTNLGGFGVEVCQSGECKNLQLAQGSSPYTAQRTLIDFNYESEPVNVNVFRRVGSGNDARKEIYLDAVVLYKVN